MKKVPVRVSLPADMYAWIYSRGRVEGESVKERNARIQRVIRGALYTAIAGIGTTTTVTVGNPSDDGADAVSGQ